MNSFYVSMIFIGIILIVASLIWIAFEKKSSHSFMKKMEDKKQEMVSIINDAEQMIEELNKFSDYIVTQMDLKNEELRANLKSADDEIKKLCLQITDKKAGFQEKAADANAADSDIKKAADVKKAPDVKRTAEVKKPAVQQKIMNGNELKQIQCQPEQYMVQNGDLVIESSVIEQMLPKRTKNTRQHAKRNDKIIPIDSRYKEILKLSNDGLSETEIAKKLSMGKGEIQLILEINKQ